jgi:hypothetical protein
MDDKWSQRGPIGRPASRWPDHVASILVVVIALAFQFLLVVATTGLGRQLLLGLSILTEYGLLWYVEQVDTLRNN